MSTENWFSKFEGLMKPPSGALLDDYHQARQSNTSAKEFLIGIEKELMYNTTMQLFSDLMFELRQAFVRIYPEFKDIEDNDHGVCTHPAYDYGFILGLKYLAKSGYLISSDDRKMSDALRDLIISTTNDDPNYRYGAIIDTLHEEGEKGYTFESSKIKPLEDQDVDKLVGIIGIDYANENFDPDDLLDHYEYFRIGFGFAHALRAISSH